MVAVRILVSLCFVVLFGTAPVYATSTPGTLTYQGRIIKPDTTPLEAAAVTFTIQVRSPDANNCLLYEDTIVGVDMTASNGIFALELGNAGNRTDGQAHTFRQAFDNTFDFPATLTCDVSNDYTPAATDGRNLVITFNDGGGPVTLSPAHEIRSVPFALVADVAQSAKAVGSIQAADVASLRDDGTHDLNQANLEAIFTTANYTELLALLAGTSSSFVNSTPTAAVDFNSQRLISVADPTGAQDAATKNYSDTNIGGTSANITGVSGATGDGKVLSWNQGSGEWQAVDLPADDIVNTPAGDIAATDVQAAINELDTEKLALAGGTMSGAIDMNGNNIVNTGHITQNADVYFHLGRFDDTAEATLVATPLGAAHEGVTWFDEEDNTIEYWDGTGVQVVGTGTGSMNDVVDDTTPQLGGTLDMNGQDISTANGFNIDITGSAGGDDFTVDTDKLVVEGDTGNVGVGVAAPAHNLDVAGAIRSGGDGSQVGYYLPSSLAIRSGTAGGSAFMDLGNVYFRDGNASSSGSNVRVYGGVGIGNGAFPNGALPSGGMIVQGDVGIGTDTPGGQLHVAGGELVLDGTGAYLDYKPNDTACGNNEVLKWSTANDRWECGTDNAGAGAQTLDGTYDQAGNTVAVDTASVIWNLSGGTNFQVAGGEFILDGTGAYLDYKPNNTACADGEVLKWDNTNDRWDCGTDDDTVGASTSRDLAAGTGLTGGGDLTADRTFNVVGGDGIVANADDIAVDFGTDKGLHFVSNKLEVEAGAGISLDANGVNVDVNGLTAEASPDGTADTVMIYDDSASALRKMTINNLTSLVGGNQNLDQVYDQNSNTVTVDGGGGDVIWNLANTEDFKIQDNGTDSFIVDDSGNTGVGAVSPGAKLHVAGDISSPGAGAGSERFGAGSLAGGADSVAVGNAADSQAADSIAIGEDAYVFSNSDGGISIGSGSYVRNWSGAAAGAIAIGRGALARGDGQVIIGDGVVGPNNVAGGVHIGDGATGNVRTVVIGTGATAGDWYATAVGHGTQSTGGSAVAIGFSSNASAANSVAIAGGNASNDNAVAIGVGANTSANGQIVFGSTDSLFISGRTGTGTVDSTIYGRASTDTTGGSIYLAPGAGSGTDGNVILAHDGTSAIGEVGVGTNAPSSKLHVFEGELTLNGTGAYLNYQPNNTECGNNEVLKWDATNDRWICGTDNAGAGAQTMDETYNQGGNTVAVDTASMVWNLSGGNNFQVAGGELILDGTGAYLDYKPNNTACADGEVLKWDNTNDRWDCGTDDDTVGAPTSRDLIAGTGLTGGGDLTADRTFNVIGGDGIVANADDIAVDFGADKGLHFVSNKLEVEAGAGISLDANGVNVDVNGLTAEVSPDGAADTVMIYDDSASALRKMTINNLTSLVGGNQDLDSVYDQGGNTVTVDSDDVIFNLASTQDFKIQDGGTDVLVVTDSGNVGIGTAGPSEKLQVGDGTADTKIEINGVNSGLLFDDDAGGLENEWTFQAFNGRLRIVDVTDAREVITFDGDGSIGMGNIAPNASAILDLSSTTKGLLPPRMTTAQRNAVTTPAEGLVVYNTTDDKLNVFDGGAWTEVGAGGTFGTGNSGFVGSIKYATTTNCQWETSAGSYSNFGTDSDCSAPSLEGAASAPSTAKTPAIRFASLPAGKYRVMAYGAPLHANGTSSVCSFAFSDGTNVEGSAYSTRNDSYSINNLVADFTYSTAQTNIEFNVQAQLTGGTGPCIIATQVWNRKFTIVVTRIDGNGTAIQIADGDGDTVIQSEESTDEDILRFDTAGVERMTIDASGNVDVTGAFAPTGTVDLTGATLTDNAISVDDLDFASASGGINIPALAADPTGSTEGQFYYNTATDQFMVYNGSTWVVASGGAGGDAALDSIFVYAGTTGTDLNCPAGYVMTGCWSYTATGASVGGTGRSGNTCVVQAGFIGEAQCTRVTGGTVTGLALEDGDGDTTIQMEESADEDFIRFDTAGAERVVIDNSGDVGIGTAAPAKRLTVATGGSAGLEYSLMLNNPNTTVGATTGILFVNDNVAGNGHKGGLVYARSGGMGVGNFHFLQNSVADSSEATLADSVFTILSNGNVGIGDTTPSNKLDVDGDVGIVGSITMPNAEPITMSDANWQVGRNIVTDSASMLNSNTIQVKVFNGSGQGFQVVNTANTPVFEVQGSDGNTHILGSLGVGVASPSSTIDLNGAVTVQEMAAPAVSASGDGRIYFDSTSKTFKVSENGGAYVDLVSTGGAPTSRDLIAGTGLTGGGDLTADRTFNVVGGAGITANADDIEVDINGLTAEASPDGAADTVMIYDDSASALRKMTINNLTSLVGGNQDLDSVYDQGGNTVTVDASDVIFNLSSTQDFRIQDNGTDSFIVDDSGNVGIGATTPGYALHVERSDETAAVRLVNSSSTAARYPGFGVENYTGGLGGSPNFYFYGSRGSAASPAPVENSDLIGAINFYGSRSTSVQDWNRGASIRAIANATFSGSEASTDLSFTTASPGSTSDTEKMRLTAEGSLGIGLSSPNASAILDLSSTTRGLLPPRMTTTDRDNISSPAEGLVVYNTTDDKLNVYDGGAWTEVGAGGTFGTGNSGFVGSLQYPTTGGCVWTSTSGSFANYSTIGSCGSPTLSGAASAPSAAKTPAIRFASLPAGKYRVTMHGAVFHATASGTTCEYAFNDGAGREGIAHNNGTTGSNANFLSADFTYTTSQSNIEFNLQAVRWGGAGSCNLYSDSLDRKATFTVVRIDGNTSAVQLADDDGDTGVNSEASSDEDILRFTTAGTERMNIDASGNINISGGLVATGTVDLTGATIADDSITIDDLDFGSSTAGINIPSLAAEPTGSTDGQMYYNTTSDKLFVYDSGTTTWTEVGSGGGSGVSDGPSFRVHKNGTNQGVSNGVPTLLTWSTEEFDTHDDFSGNRFTPSVAGKYIVTAQTYCTNSTTRCQVRIYKNGSMVNYASADNEKDVVNTAAVIDMNGTTDYLEAYGLNAGGNTISGNAVHTNFTGALISGGSDLGDANGIDVPALASAPATPDTGQMYLNTTDDRLHIYDGSVWKQVTDISSGDIIGNWSSSYSLGTNYQAATDLLVVVTTVAGSETVTSVAAYTDSTATPTTLIARAAASSASGVEWPKHNSLTIPVKRGDYWRITRGYTYGSSSTETIFVVPLSGSASDLGDGEGIDIPPLASAPSSPDEGQVYYNTSNDKLYVYDGSAWQEVGSGAGGGGGGVAAWVSFNGANGSIFGSSNVSSVTRNSAGSYTINYQTAFADTNYSVTCSASHNSGTTWAGTVVIESYGTAATNIVSASNNNPSSGLPYDPARVSCATYHGSAGGGSLGDSEGIDVPTLASAPSSPDEGQMYYNTTDDKLYVWDGAAWKEVGSGAGGGDPSHMTVYRNAAWNNVSAGTIIGLDGVASSQGSKITANLGSNYVTLQGGTTYRITARARMASSSPSGWLTYSVWDSTNSVVLGQTGGENSFNVNATSSTLGDAMAIVKPSSDINIQFRIGGATSGVDVESLVMQVYEMGGGSSSAIDADGVDVPTLASAPGSPDEGQMYYNTTDDKIYVYDGSAWQEVGSGAGGGGGGVTDSVVDGMPDVIKCTNGSTTRIVYHRYSTSTQSHYSSNNNGYTTEYRLNFDTNPLTNASTNGANLSGYDCVSKTVTQLYSEGKAFNFVGGDATETSALDKGFPDAIVCDDGSKQRHLFFELVDATGQRVYKVHNDGFSTVYVVNFSSAGAFNSHSNMGGFDCINKSIATLNSEGKAKYFGNDIRAIASDEDEDTKITVEASTDEDIIRFDTAGTERMVIDETGRVGIGISPAILGAELSVGGSSGGTFLGINSPSAENAQLRFSENSTIYWQAGHKGSDDSFQFFDYQNSTTPMKIEAGAANNTLIVDSADRVGIKTASPSTSLDVAGLIRAYGSDWPTAGAGIELAYSAGNAMIQGYDRTGTAWRPVIINGSTVTLNNMSDERLKTNITEIPRSESLDKIMTLRPVTYNWKDASRDEEQGLQTGLIAQEVQKVFPSLVTHLGDDRINHEDGGSEPVEDILGVNYTGLIVPMLRSIQELNGICEMSQEQSDRVQEQLENHDRRIASLEKENEKMKEENEKIKAENAMMKEFFCQKYPEAPFCK